MLARPLALLAAIALAAACQAAPDAKRPADRPALGLMTSLPLIWSEAGDVSELLQSDQGGSWVRQALDQRYMLKPLDTLDDASLAGLDRLILAQPRALGPAENVALDAWLRGGGRLLLFADPMLTRHSRYSIGDPRRPQDVALLSPILAHWGLELLFDDRQNEDERIVAVLGMRLPVALSGTFRLGPEASCSLAEGGVVARCRIGQGRLVAVADAALLDDVQSGPLEPREPALDRLLAITFD